MAKPSTPFVVALALGCLAVARIRRAFRPLSTIAMRPYRARRDADERAEALLRTLLSPTEYEQLLVDGYLEVTSPTYPERIYEVPRCGGTVTVREDGRVVGGLCVRPVEPVPAADVVLMHKLMIEGAESKYLRLANKVEADPFPRHCLSMIHET